MFLIFHAGDDGEGGELDYASIGAPVGTLRTGVNYL
jgi:hypothetical protein